MQDEVTKARRIEDLNLRHSDTENSRVEQELPKKRKLSVKCKLVEQHSWKPDGGNISRRRKELIVVSAAYG